MLSRGARGVFFGVLGSRIGVIAATLGVCGVWGAALAGSAAAAGPCGSTGVYSVLGATATCTYTGQGTEDTFTVPGFVSSLSVTSVGAPGGARRCRGAWCGRGRHALPVTPGSTIDADVGQPGPTSLSEAGGASTAAAD